LEETRVYQPSRVWSIASVRGNGGKQKIGDGVGRVGKMDQYVAKRAATVAAPSAELVRTAPSRPFFCGRDEACFSQRNTIRQRA
jgi:hypothetical protein